MANNAVNQSFHELSATYLRDQHQQVLSDMQTGKPASYKGFNQYPKSWQNQKSLNNF